MGKLQDSRFDPYVAAEALGAVLGLKMWECSRFAGEITGTYDDNWKTNELREAVAQLKLQKDIKDEMIVAIVDTMDRMNKTYRNSGAVYNFNANRNSNAGYCHELAPLELCGHGEQRGYLTALNPILQKVGINVDVSDIFKECDKRTVALLKDCYLKDPTPTENQLNQYAVSKGLENYLIENDVGGALRGSDYSNRQFVQNVVIPDLMRSGFGASVHLKHELLELKLQFDAEINERAHANEAQSNKSNISIEDALQILANNPELIPWDDIEKHLNQEQSVEIDEPEFGNK